MTIHRDKGKAHTFGMEQYPSRITIDVIILYKDWSLRIPEIKATTTVIFTCYLQKTPSMKINTSTPHPNIQSPSSDKLIYSFFTLSFTELKK